MFKRKTYYEAKSKLLEDLLESAGEEKRPPPPQSEIPHQWIPNFVRLPLKCLALPYILLDGLMQRLARVLIRPPFRREGKCKRRGNCCYYILIRHSKGLAGRLLFFWQTQINGFYLRYSQPQVYEGKRMLVMGCRYLTNEGSCSQYWLRPQICRQWPVIEHFGYPKILKGCGFRSIPPFPPEKSEDAFSKGGQEDKRLSVLK